MRIGLIVGMVGTFVATAGVAGAGYYGWELYQAGSLDKRFAAFQTVEQALDIELKYDRNRVVGQAFTPGFALEKVTVVSDDKTVEVGRIEFRRFDWARPEKPRFAHILLTGIRMDGDVLGSFLGSEMGKALADPKFKNLSVDAAIQFEAEDIEVEDPKTKRKVAQKKVVVNELKLSIAELGSVTFTLELRDFAVQPKAVARAVREYPPLVRLLGEKVLFAGGKAVYEDKGLMQAIIDAKAQELGKGELQARGAFVRELQRDAQTTRSAVGSNRFDKAYFEVMIRYIGGGYERSTGFTLISAPPQPIELRRLFIMWDSNRGGFFDAFNPRLELGASRRPEPKKKAEDKDAKKAP